MLIHPLRFYSEVICVKHEVQYAYVLYEHKYVDLMQKWTKYLILAASQVFKCKGDGRFFSWRLKLMHVGFVVD
jgi:hypothetical protein